MMTDIEINKFKWRSFTSLYITISFLVIIVSGLVLYIAPPGRIAKWAYIPIIGFEKHQWQALHIIFTFSFIVASAFHLYFNWSPFISYLKDKLSKRYRLKQELFYASVLTIGLFILVLWDIPPFKNVIEFGESMKNTWSTESDEPPIPHAEELTVEQLAGTLKIEPDQLIQLLKEQGINASPNAIIKDLAEEYDFSPNELFRKIAPRGQFTGTKSHQGKGYGRKTIRQIAQEENITVIIARKRLSAAGIKADSDDTIRSVAGNNDLLPIDIVNIILDKKE